MNRKNNDMHTSINNLRAPEPIAIIGLGCRFPGGANDWQSYWSMLDQGRDAISETPEDRWDLEKFYAPDNSLPGKTQSKWGGYVDGIDMFDPQLFGISPREAASMDPQQRMLLEVAYRAIEDAGKPLKSVAGEPVSVFVGISSFDYAVAGLSPQDRGVINPYSNTGGSSSIAANRLSYCFDLRGPSVAVDTACSSSLVALHMACESIWRGDASMSLAGGVNALVMPDFYVAFSQLGVLSPDGRCKTFDARANGYVRSEGAGMVLLKPMGQAIRDKDPIYAVIRGTALNQDGRTPGMTVPSQQAQETLLNTACQKANIQPSEISYVEAHGTGTPVGDPIEARALGSVLGSERDPSTPCRIGSVKTNIGHLEAGAGIASVIKVALALHHRKIPAHLHYQTANPDIDFEALGLKVPTHSQAWDCNGPRIAGINGFGYGGANAHAILEEAPQSAAKVMPRPATPIDQNLDSSDGSAEKRSDISSKSQMKAPVLLPISAQDKAGLSSMSGLLADWLEQNSDYPIAEVAGYLAHRRHHHSARTTACATSRDEMIKELRALSASTPEEFAEDIGSAAVSRGVAFVCSGQGPQWWAMGRGLLKYSPAFRTVIKRCDAEFRKFGMWSLVEELSRGESESRMQETSIAQPSIFAIQVALAAVWESWGIKPEVVVGHSVGEIAAAYLSGALSWEDACCVAFHRGRTMDLATSHGAMVAAGISAAEVEQWIKGQEDQVALAAINGPSSVTISGDATAIEKLAARLDDEGIFCRRLAVEYAFHSPQMEPVKDELLASLSHIRSRKPHTRLISTVTGEAIQDAGQVDGEYWWQNVRQSVRFSDAMNSLAETGIGVAIEIGPHPVLAYSINECFQASQKSIRSIPSLNRQQDDLQCIAKSLGSLYSFGFDIEWKGFYNEPIHKVPVPNYPFQLQRCWYESLETQVGRNGHAAHALLGEKVDGPVPRWEQRIDLELQPYLAGHQVRGGCVYPAAAMIETILTAARDVGQQDAVRLQRLQFQNPCMLSEQDPQWIETSYDADKRKFSLAFRSCRESEWTPLAHAKVSFEPPRPPSRSIDWASIRARCEHSFNFERLYAYCDEIGLNYSAPFKGVRNGIHRKGESLVEVELSPGNAYLEDSFKFHPALLDSCFHAMIAADPNFDQINDGIYLPYSIAQVDFFQAPTRQVQVHAKVLSKSKRALICDIDIFDERGHLCLSIKEFESLRVSGTKPSETLQDLIYSYEWEEHPIESDDTAIETARRWLVFMDEAGLGRELVQRIQKLGDEVVEVYHADSSVGNAVQNDFYQVDPERCDSFKEMLANVSFDGSASAIDRIVYLWGLDSPQNESLDTEQLDRSSILNTLAPMHLVQAWEQHGQETTAEATFVTQGAQSEDGPAESTAVAQGQLIGFARVIVSEFGGWISKLVDLPAQTATADIDHLVAELLAGDDEDEVMWRGGKRLVHRFNAQVNQPASEKAIKTYPCQLRVGESSGVEELHYQTKSIVELSQGEVEIEVVAAGLNFSDVMKALNLYPGLPNGPVDLGAECSGRITRVGTGSRFNVGDEVIAIAPGAFSTRVIVNDVLVARKPSNLSHEEAAAIPVAFLTAHYALNECARIRSGESVLIHAATGGVGLAAIQLAKLAGAEIYATAGTDEKRQLASEQGAIKVMDSRSLAFADETLEATNGQGVDVILNSLPGEAISKGLSILQIGGRFLEIGKRDIYGDSELGMYPFRNNLSLFAIDLDQLFKQQAARMGQMLELIVEQFEAGILEPLPVKSYPAKETVAAFRFMQQGKHIGKVVIRYDELPQDVRNGAYEPIEFQEDATYWIAGGLGGFGLQIAKWMIEKGAKSLVLSSRRREVDANVKAAISELISAGARIAVLPADITVESDVQRVLATIKGELPPLKGIIHSAMILEDKLLVDLDRPTLERVLRPKVVGAWNLHKATMDYDLDYFVLFSSLSSVFGHAGQANYSAANAMLDSLAYHRTSLGLPATVMNWGHLGEVGYLAEREQLGQRLERQGVLSFTVQQATSCLEYALQTESIQLSVLRMNWSVWRGLGITNRVSPRFAHLLLHSEEESSNYSVITGEVLRQADSPQRLNLITQALRNKTSQLLGIASDQINSDRALLEMGLDSLMAVEMRNWIEGQLEINVPISALMRSESLADLANQLNLSVSGIDSDDAPGLAETPTETTVESNLEEADPEELLKKLPELGSEQVSELLGQMLKEQK